MATEQDSLSPLPPNSTFREAGQNFFRWYFHFAQFTSQPAGEVCTRRFAPGSAAVPSGRTVPDDFFLKRAELWASGLSVRDPFLRFQIVLSTTLCQSSAPHPNESSGTIGQTGELAGPGKHTANESPSGSATDAWSRHGGELALPGEPDVCSEFGSCAWFSNPQALFLSPGNIPG